MLKQIMFLIFIFFVSGCGQDYNSNTNDKSQYTTVEIDTSTPQGSRFALAYKVLQTQCFECHAWSVLNTSERWVDSGYVTRGNYTDSPIIGILKNYGGTMPKDPYPAMTTTDLAILEDWITNM